MSNTKFAIERPMQLTALITLTRVVISTSMTLRPIGSSKCREIAVSKADQERDSRKYVAPSSYLIASCVEID